MTVEHIQYTDTLRQGADKINAAIDQSNEAIEKATTADANASQALATANNVQTQLNTIVIEGDSSVEAAQARVDADGRVFATLKERLDTKETQFQQRTLSVEDFGAVGDGVTDDTAAFLAANEYGGRILLDDKTYVITDTIPLKCRFEGKHRNKTILLFKNLGTKSAINNFGGGFTSGLSNLTIKAASWDEVEGCLGYGIEIINPIYMYNVVVSHFKKSNIFLHHDETGYNGPYYSNLTNVVSDYSGEHGILIGTGANSILLINPVARWNGSPEYGVVPTTQGNYDGIHVSENGDGNPNNALISYAPEGVRIVGGDASYNSRYGWNIDSTRNSHITTDYSEGNLHTDQIAVGYGVRASYIDFAMGGTGSINTDDTTTIPHPNVIFVAGKFFGNGAIDSDGKFINRQLQFLKNCVSFGTDCSVYMLSNEVGRTVFKGEGYNPAIILVNVNLAAPNIEGVDKLSFSIGSNADLYVKKESTGYLTVTGNGFQPQINFDLYQTKIKRLELGDGHAPIQGTSSVTHKIPIVINGTTYYLLASTS